MRRDGLDLKDVDDKTFDVITVSKITLKPDGVATLFLHLKSKYGGELEPAIDRESGVHVFVSPSKFGRWFMSRLCVVLANSEWSRRVRVIERGTRVARLTLVKADDEEDEDDDD